MMLTWSRRHTLVAGIALIAITNAVALGGVAWNRSGEPDSVLKLTQRELWHPSRFKFDKESGGLDLNMRWRVPAAETGSWFYVDQYGTPEWLDRAKLAALRFDVSQRSDAHAAERHSERLLPREALVVLEFDGPAYRKALERARDRAEKEAAKAAAGTAKTGPGSPAQNAAEFLKREEASNSRLFAVDAGLDAAALRAKYPDRTRYAIVRGSIRAHFNRSRAGEAQWTGHIESVDNASVNVPLEFRRALPAVQRSVPWGAVPEGGPAFEVVVAFGKRFEPWIVAARAVTAK